LPITITLLIAIAVTSISLICFARFPFIGQGVLRFAFISRNFFGRLSHPELESRTRISRCAQRSAART
jgi:hypothetical protein